MKASLSALASRQTALRQSAPPALLSLALRPRCLRARALWGRYVCLLSIVAAVFSQPTIADLQTLDASRLDGNPSRLWVVLGCGSEKSADLAAEIASSSAVLVHGIALDEAGRVRAQRAIRARGVGGLVAVEVLPLMPLPYRDNLVNAVLVDDSERAKAAGFSATEAMRVIAPGGKLYTRKGDLWEVTQKPWPKEMDDWTHEAHGPDGNCVSKDRVVKFPVGYRWHSGLPMNLQRPGRTANTWSSTRGLALASGRCFTLTDAVFENLGPTYRSEHGLDQYVTARDAFNGLLLWRRNLGGTYYGGLFYPNRAPFVAVDERVYAANEDGKLLALEAATGEIVHTFETKYSPGVIVVDGGVLAIATWKNGSKVGGLDGEDRRRMTFAIAEGTIEAFDLPSGKKLWSMEKLATSFRSSDGVLFALERGGADPVEEFQRRRGVGVNAPRRPRQAVFALDLRSGDILWSVGTDVLGGDEPLRLDAAGLGVIAVSHNNGEKTSVLSAKDGRLLLEASADSYTAFHNGAIQLGDGRYDPRTGKRLGEAAFSLASTICTPRYFVNNIFVNNRGGKYQIGGESVRYRGVRGGCLFASVPAFGQFFTPQNWCRCAPGQIQGFVAFGPIAREPTPAEMERAPPVEVGPAFGKLAGKLGADAWPTYRHDSQRSSQTSGAAPARLDTLWKTSVCQVTPGSPIRADWRERLASPLTAPTVAGGLVVVAATDHHDVVALDALSGNERWRFTAGARVDTPPTLHEGGCFFGANDGYVYALSSHDGRLAWRTRAAPLEERMVSYGKVESPWPVSGAVLVSQGLLFASAGRSGASDGGIVVRALEPTTGRAVWSKSLVEPRLNDILLEVGDSIQWMSTHLDPRTGTVQPEDGGAEVAPRIGLEGFACGNWLRLGSRKHAPMAFGNVSADLLSWNEQAVCAADADGTLKAFPRDQVRSSGEPAGKVWNITLPNAYQATSMVLCPDGVVVGGGVHTEGEAGSGGFVRVLSLEDGQPLVERKLPAPVSYNGLALSAGRLYATLTQGTTICLGTQAGK